MRYTGILLTGDANVNLFNNITTGVVRYTDILYEYGFIPHITLSTRVTELSCTLIDLICLMGQKSNETGEG